MKKEPQRKMFSLMLSNEERDEIKRRSDALGMSANGYIRFMVFQEQKEISSTRSHLANGTIPEINVKIYRSLCDIAHSLREISQRHRNAQPINFTPVHVDSHLLEETLKLVKKIGLQLASNKN
ncbi:MAG: hypothetical protein QNJ54_32215 [Prochloraceae cyanobacterium]|nr:hypothetical protein [Prochloraceae cyanobacterium]